MIYQNKWFILHKVCQREPPKSVTKLGYYTTHNKHHEKRRITATITYAQSYRIFIVAYMI